jgi:hypothetical protein
MHTHGSECPGCCGFDVFETSGSRVYGPVAIHRESMCCEEFPELERRFPDDGAAHRYARALYRERWKGHRAGTKAGAPRRSARG